MHFLIAIDSRFSETNKLGENLKPSRHIELILIFTLFIQAKEKKDPCSHQLETLCYIFNSSSREKELFFFLFPLFFLEHFLFQNRPG